MRIRGKEGEGQIQEMGKKALNKFLTGGQNGTELFLTTPLLQVSFLDGDECTLPPIPPS